VDNPERHLQHWVHKIKDEDKQGTETQHRDTCNIGYTRYKTKTNKTQKQTTTLKRWATRTPPKTGDEPKGKQFLSLIRYPACYS